MVIRGSKCKALKFLSRSELDAIHSATLEVLKKTEMHSESDKILKIFDESGADVSFKDRRIRIPEHRSINVAKRKVEEILREHQPEPLKEDIKQRLSEIVKEAEKKLTKTG